MLRCPGMRWWRAWAFACIAVAGLAAAGCDSDDGPTSPAGQVPAPPPGVAAELQHFVSLMNQHRTEQGLAPLAWDARAAAVAQAHSADMVARSFFSHTNPDGDSPFDRMAAAGITYSTAGENIAYGYPSAESVLAAWLNSPGHRSNIENAGYTHHGVGLVGTHWTHLFLRPR